jgi:hypothetical protein
MKQWYDDLDDCTKQLTLNSLTFTCFASFIFQDIISTKIERMLTAVKIYRLKTILKRKFQILY